MNEDIKKLGNFLAKEIRESRDEILEAIDTLDMGVGESEDWGEGEDTVDDDLEYKGVRKVESKIEEEKKEKKKLFKKKKDESS